MQFVTIKNEFLEVKIHLLGAEIKSVKKDGVERVFTGDEKFWHGSAPILFPIAGSLKDGCYYYKGQKYELGSHGFARKKTFEVFSLSETCATFLLMSDEQTKVSYPFDFNFFVTYSLKNSSLKVIYKIENKSQSEMWALFGCHESYAISGDISEYSVEFEKNENLLSRVVERAALVGDNYDDFGQNTRILKLTPNVFAHDTAIFTNIGSRKVALKKGDKKQAELEFNTKNLLIWTVPGAPFVCLEAWQNYPDTLYTDGDILKKDGVIIIPAGSFIQNDHTITYFEL